MTSSSVRNCAELLPNALGRPRGDVVCGSQAGIIGGTKLGNYNIPRLHFCVARQVLW